MSSGLGRGMFSSTAVNFLRCLEPVPEPVSPPPLPIPMALERHQKEITYLGADQIRMLVGFPINLMCSNDQIIKLRNEKIIGYVDRLSASTLKPGNILFDYQHYCSYL